MSKKLPSLSLSLSLFFFPTPKKQNPPPLLSQKTPQLSNKDMN